MDLNFSFGYLDHQLYWQTLLDFSAGKPLYKNIFWEYSLLPILIRLPFFLLLQKTFFASTAINLVILPIIGIILSFYIGKQLLGKKALFLFMFLLLFMGTNTNYSNVRYLIPELGLLMVILGLEKDDKKKTFIGSVLMGISLLTSVEYAIASHLGLILYFCSVLMLRRKKIKKQFLYLLLFEGFIGSAFLIYLLSNNAFHNFISFHTEYLKSFYSEGPCREFFPRLDVFQQLKSKPFETFFHINYYFVPFFIFITGLWLLFKINIRYKLILLVLLVYSLLVSYRIISSPCYYSYGMTFPFLILSYLIFQAQISKSTRGIFIGLALWFILSSNPFDSFRLQSWNNNVEKEYLPTAGIFLNKKLTREYKNITAYIQAHTTTEDYIYTHRVGPYNQLAQRKSPVSVASSSVYEAAPFLVDITLSELKKNPPSYVVINTYNGDSYSNSIRNIRANVHISGNNIVFEGDNTPIEDYISQNYKIDKIFNIAWVLKRREVPVQLIPYYVSVPGQAQWSVQTQRLKQKMHSAYGFPEYEVTDKNPVIVLSSPAIKEAEHIEMPVLVDLGAFKPYSKFIVSFFLVTNTGKTIELHDNIITSEWSTAWIYIPRKELFPKGVEIAGVIMLVSENYGFFPFGKPVSIKLGTPRLYIKNPALRVSTSGYKKNY